MKKGLLFFFFGILLSTASFSQDCFTRLQKAFDDRGAYAVADDMHRNVYLSFFEDGSSRCVGGKARVENGKVVSVFMQYDDDTYQLMDAKFFNSQKGSPEIINGISEMIYTSEGEKFKVVFIEQLKPKQKSLKQVELPDDL